MAIEMKVSDKKQNDSGIIKLSASSMKTFDQCPKKYYFNYIERAPRKQWDHFDLGNLCHKTLEIFHKIYMEEGLKTHKTLTKLMGYSFAEARKSFSKVDDTIISEAKLLIQGYLNIVKRSGMPLVRGVETEFSFNVSETVIVRGFLDRVDVMKDGKFHIVDYKTTKNTQYLDAFQLLIYGLWLQREFPHVNEFDASYILLRHNSKPKTYNFNTHDVIQAKKKILDFADKINHSKETNDWATMPTRLCNWCDFKNICPTQKGW